MNREIPAATLRNGFYKGFKQPDAVNVWLKPVVNNLLKTLLFGIHHNYGSLNSCISEQNTFVGNSYCEVINILILQQTGNFNIAAAIRKCFYHHHYFCFGPNYSPENIEVVNKRAQVYFQLGLMRFLLQKQRNFFECKLPGAFY